jgi:peptidoglycan hydrolase CwlO-like protein
MMSKMILVVVLISLVLAQSSFPSHIQASLQDDYNRIKQEQQRLKQQIDEKKAQGRTLAGDIEAMDDQIVQTQTEIEQTKAKIGQTNQNLATVTANLTDLEQKIVRTQDIADERMRQMYMAKRTPDFSAIVAAKNFQQAVLNVQYSKELELEDKRLLTELGQNRKAATLKKTQLDQLKEEQLNLRVQLEAQEQVLGETKSSKENLLEETKNDEAEYQRHLAIHDAALNNILNALSGAKIRIGRVSRGQMIAREASTGCSTGSHLHFSYRLSPTSSWINPAPYLSSGALGKPESGYPGNVTQWFGQNAVPGAYGRGGHDAIDMSTGYGTPIYAAKDGVAYAATDNGCPQLGIGTRRGHGIIIDHDDGTQTLYWHIQP